ncbi:hypothetical protein [Streptomyces hydrogenans]|uniref:hypothetical protein n=1 Tax=Streptomyces hydrogenans TaxID=1873719 RepID=UPI0035DA6589
MRKILLPNEDEVPAGPNRRLLVELHSLYRQAGSPSLRGVTMAVRQIDERTAEVSHQTVSNMLKLAQFSSWARLEAVVLALAKMSVLRPKPRHVAEWFHALWELTTSSETQHGIARPPLLQQRPDGMLAPGDAAGLSCAPDPMWAADEMPRVNLLDEEGPDTHLVEVQASDEETRITVNPRHPMAAPFRTGQGRRTADLSKQELREQIRQMRRAFDILMIAWGMTAGSAPSAETRRLLAQAQQTWSQNAITVHVWDQTDLDWSDPSTWRWMN